MKYTNLKKLLVLFLVSVAIVFKTIVFQKGFNWFISPIFNINEISLWQSVAFLLFIGFVFKYKAKDFNKVAEPTNFEELKQKAILKISNSIIFLLFFTLLYRLFI